MLKLLTQLSFLTHCHTEMGVVLDVVADTDLQATMIKTTV